MADQVASKSEQRYSVGMRERTPADDERDALIKQVGAGKIDWNAAVKDALKAKDAKVKARYGNQVAP